MTDRQQDETIGSGTGMSGSGGGDFADGMEGVGISNGGLGSIGGSGMDDTGTGGLDRGMGGDIAGSGTGLSGSGGGDFAEGMSGHDQPGNAMETGGLMGGFNSTSIGGVSTGAADINASDGTS